ncbi:toll/interleukin-1 receptor domain-containing adapter protein isoform X1 [Triplophysa dalaica]|uniref:toll/interleukin-1 receptor domain-containing adapter protein isoform X1 n=1 Tax=Triplophysa dalaica TaxID=1582913 RepID=UPI0024DFB7F8|nr:toll/interleukin-1 receptor domain-containing adapter protein isoform X1 [Triplophysa dalaica]
MEKKRVSGIMGWFHQHFGKQRNELDQGNSCTCPQKDNFVLSNCKSSSGNHTYTTHCETSCSVESSVSSASSSLPCKKTSISSYESPLPAVLSSTFRSTLKYDVCLCHSDKDIDQVHSLVSFLEAPSKGLRCYLLERDCPPGGAVSTELLQALHDSHCWVLFITPNFLKDDWCLYQMHQVLSEGPISQRIIPAVLNIPRSELPQELRFVFCVDFNRNIEGGYNQVYKTLIHYLKDMLEKEESCNVAFR